MKKTIFWLAAFAITFTLGYFFVPSVFKRVKIEEPKPAARTKEVTASGKWSPEIVNVYEEYDDTKEFIVKLLEPGELFHGDEVIGKTGETWLGLFEENDKYFLRSTKLKIDSIHDGIVDDKKSQTSGKSVAVNTKSIPLFLLKNADYLEEGDIVTLKKALKYNEIPDDSSDKQITYINVGFSQTYEINGTKYELQAIEAVDQHLKKVFALVLIGDGKRQIVHTSYDESESLGTLYWVGDLDKDGKPDFYMELFVHYNVLNRVLFLSSKAGENEIIRKVAEFVTTGC